jgi:hypothetical protein|tara:strand:- start:403 stop:606 length:204 start_codon:yes stop_codon:yes gene_type:complete
MSAMKRHLENKIARLQDEKNQNRAIITDAFNNNEISYEHYISEMNALDNLKIMNGKIMNAKMNGELS